MGKHIELERLLPAVDSIAGDVEDSVLTRSDYGTGRLKQLGTKLRHPGCQD